MASHARLAGSEEQLKIVGEEWLEPGGSASHGGRETRQGLQK